MKFPLVAVFDHRDGSRSELLYDEDGSYANPRECDGNIATLIQRNTSNIDVDSDDEGLSEAVEKLSWPDLWSRKEVVERRHPCFDHTDLLVWDGADKGREHGESRGEYLMRRYLAMFRPDILHFGTWRTPGRDPSYGWGYVTRDAWESAMIPEGAMPAYDHEEPGTFGYLDDDDNYHAAHATPAECFEAEVKLYGQWAEGEVYGVASFEPSECRVCGSKVRPAFNPDDENEPLWTAGDLIEGTWTDKTGDRTDPATCTDGGDHVPADDTASDSCWGFLGYESEREIVEQVNSAPIIAEHWAY